MGKQKIKSQIGPDGARSIKGFGSLGNAVPHLPAEWRSHQTLDGVSFLSLKHDRATWCRVEWAVKRGPARVPESPVQRDRSSRAERTGGLQKSRTDGLSGGGQQ